MHRQEAGSLSPLVQPSVVATIFSVFLILLVLCGLEIHTSSTVPVRLAMTGEVHE